jgi:ABC-2 type transport system ATP-binding protein
MLSLVHRIGSEFGIAVVVASHLLSEIERICDWIVAIDGGALLRSAALSSMTGSVPWLAVEVEEGTDALAQRLSAAGHALWIDGPALVLRADTDEVFTLIRDAVAELELPLARIEQRRHHVEELFAQAAGPGVPVPTETRP